jgi:prepilin-type N-terminal cleavage/methylation domain-containing protein
MKCFSKIKNSAKGACLLALRQRSVLGKKKGFSLLEMSIAIFIFSKKILSLGGLPWNLWRKLSG